MSNEEPNTPAGTTRERAAFADRAEQLLRETLVALGYDAANLTAADLVHGFACWLGILQMYRAEPTSPAAEWWQRVWQSTNVAPRFDLPRAHLDDAVDVADHAAIAFLRRFPPRFEPVDRQSLDDLAAMRDALDEQTDATERARIQSAEWQRRAEIAERNEGILLDKLAARAGSLVPQPKPERVEPGQRWAFVDDVAKVRGDTAKLLMGEDADSRWMLESQDWIFLGPVPKSEE